MHYPRNGPADPALASDFCFIGTAFASRIRFFEAMDLDGIDMLLAGADWGSLDPDSPLAKHVATGVNTDLDCIENERTAELYRQAKASLNFYRREAEEEHSGEGWACGPREIELAACGIPFLRDPRPESDELFGKFLPSFDGPEDASEKLRWMLTHPSEREKAASLAREAIQDRTFENSARRLLKLLDGL